MALRKNNSSFENSVAKHEKIINKSSIGRAALLRSLDDLDASSSSDLAKGTVSINKVAETMQGILSPIDNANYTKPPLSSDTLASIAGKLVVYNTIAGAATPVETTEVKPTDTSKIDTAKRKA